MSWTDVMGGPLGQVNNYFQGNLANNAALTQATAPQYNPFASYSAAMSPTSLYGGGGFGAATDYYAALGAQYGLATGGFGAAPAAAPADPSWDAWGGGGGYTSPDYGSYNIPAPAPATPSWDAWGGGAGDYATSLGGSSYAPAYQSPQSQVQPSWNTLGDASWYPQGYAQPAVPTWDAWGGGGGYTSPDYGSYNIPAPAAPSWDAWGGGGGYTSPDYGSYNIPQASAAPSWDAWGGQTPDYGSGYGGQPYNSQFPNYGGQFADPGSALTNWASSFGQPSAAPTFPDQWGGQQPGDWFTTVTNNAAADPWGAYTSPYGATEPQAYPTGNASWYPQQAAPSWDAWGGQTPDYGGGYGGQPFNSQFPNQQAAAAPDLSSYYANLLGGQGGGWGGGSYFDPSTYGALGYGVPAQPQGGTPNWDQQTAWDAWGGQTPDYGAGWGVNASGNIPWGGTDTSGYPSAYASPFSPQASAPTMQSMFGYDPTAAPQASGASWDAWGGQTPNYGAGYGGQPYNSQFPNDPFAGGAPSWDSYGQLGAGAGSASGMSPWYGNPSIYDSVGANPSFVQPDYSGFYNSMMGGYAGMGGAGNYFDPSTYAPIANWDQQTNPNPTWDQLTSPANNYNTFQQASFLPPWQASIPQGFNSPDVVNAVNQQASQLGVDPAAFAAMIQMESGWDPRNVTGQYAGMTQMGKSTFDEAGGTLGGLTWDQYRNGTAAQQIGAYGDWLSHYAANSPNSAASLVSGGIGSLPPEMQAAIMQGTQFGPNKVIWPSALGQGNMGMPVSSGQAEALGRPPSIGSMYDAYTSMMGGWPQQQLYSNWYGNPNTGG